MHFKRPTHVSGWLTATHGAIIFLLATSITACAAQPPLNAKPAKEFQMPSDNDAKLIDRLLEMIISSKNAEDLDIDIVRRKTGINVGLSSDSSGDYAGQIGLESGQQLIVETAGISESTGLARIIFSPEPGVTLHCAIRHPVVHAKLTAAGFSGAWRGGREGSLQSWRYRLDKQMVHVSLPPNTGQQIEDICVVVLMLDVRREE